MTTVLNRYLLAKCLLVVMAYVLVASLNALQADESEFDDPAMVGTWYSSGTRANGTEWRVRWDIQLDGHYAFSGTYSDRGTLLTQQGFYRTISEVSSLNVAEGHYSIKPDGSLVVTGSNGTSVWQKANPQPGPDLKAADPGAVANQAEKIFAGGNYNAAITLLSRLLAVQPSFEKAWRYRELMFSWMVTNKLNISFEVAPFIGRNLRLGQSATLLMAQADGEMAVQLDPNDAVAWCTLARDYQAAQNNDKARQAYINGLQADPNDAEGHLDYGYFEYCQGEDGGPEMQRGFAINPSLHDNYDSLQAEGIRRYHYAAAQNKAHALFADAWNRWSHAKSHDEMASVLSPWAACGQYHNAVTLTYRLLGYYHNSSGWFRNPTFTQTFPAIGIRLGSGMVVWVPVRQADADAIPRGFRVRIGAPPGVAAYAPAQPITVYATTSANGDEYVAGDELDSLYLQHLQSH